MIQLLIPLALCLRELDEPIITVVPPASIFLSISGHALLPSMHAVAQCGLPEHLRPYSVETDQLARKRRGMAIEGSTYAV